MTSPSFGHAAPPLPMTSAALTDAFLSFSGTPLFVLVNMSTSCFRRYKDAMRARERDVVFSQATPGSHPVEDGKKNVFAQMP